MHKVLTDEEHIHFHYAVHVDNFLLSLTFKRFFLKKQIKFARVFFSLFLLICLQNNVHFGCGN